MVLSRIWFRCFDNASDHRAFEGLFADASHIFLSTERILFGILIIQKCWLKIVHFQVKFISSGLLETDSILNNESCQNCWHFTHNFHEFCILCLLSFLSNATHTKNHCLVCRADILVTIRPKDQFKHLKFGSDLSRLVFCKAFQFCMGICMKKIVFFCNVM